MSSCNDLIIIDNYDDALIKILTDEMNGFIPQSMQTQIELKEIADVKKNIITPRLSKPIIELVQDSILGSYKMTLADLKQKIDWKDAMNLAMYVDDLDLEKVKKGKTYTGHELYSLLIPDMINSTKGDFNLVDGDLLKGTVDKGTLKGNIVNNIWDKYGPVETKNFIDSAQRVISNWLLQEGCTVGIGDIILEDELRIKIKTIIEGKISEINHLITKAENNPNMITPVAFEMLMVGILGVVQTDLGKLASDNLPPDNNWAHMLRSGSKGGNQNVAKVMAAYALDMFGPNLVPKKINNRTLPHFFQNDDMANSRGFHRHNYLEGLTPTEYFLHHMCGRVGLIDTAIKSVTGDTDIIILDDKVRKISIGKWINGLLNKRYNSVQRDDDRELLQLNSDVYIPTSDLDGNVTWGKVTAVTRHNPSEILYEIKTHGGRKVTVTDSHSLLIWNNETGKLERIKPTKINVGNFVPVTGHLGEAPIVNDSIDMPELGTQFEFTYDNGLFLGLGISEHISNKDSKITNFVKNWSNGYDKEIVGKILYKLCGSSNKFIHPECFNANLNFIRGLIDGVVSSDGIITENSIQYTSTSKQLIIDLNVCLSRLGIFGKKSGNVLTIGARYVEDFSKEIKLISDDKQKALNEMITSIKLEPTNQDFAEHNDVVLDKIIEINKIVSKDHTKYKKVYDMTVPSTLNFGIANGLHVVDTADTGYISRKLMKALEDIMIAYDGTVRNSVGGVVQFSYGDSGVDQTRQTYQFLRTISKDNKEIKEMMQFTSAQMAEILKKTKGSKPALVKVNEEYYNEFLEMLHEMRICQKLSITDYITITERYLFPVNVERVIRDNSKIFSEDDKNEYLDPVYINAELDKLLTADETVLLCMTKKDVQDVNSIKNTNEREYKFLFKLLLHEHLAPKRCLYEYKLNKYKFDVIIKEIKDTFNKSIVEPGEMVGSIAAQSIGEPSTQMTLDSVDWYEKITYKDENNISHIVRIGEFIDNLIKKEGATLLNNELETEYLDIEHLNYMVPSVDENGYMYWKKLEAITRHIPSGDGKLIKIKTNMGREVSASKSKSLLVRIDNKIVPIDGDKVKVGDRLPIVINSAKTEYIDFISLENILPKTEYCYGSEINKAVNEQRTNKFWWKKRGTLFQTPFKRGDSLQVSARNLEYLDGRIYNRCRSGSDSFFEENFKLDELSGFFVGAYIAEGCVSDTQTKISNNESIYREKVIKFCDRYKIKTHVEQQINVGPNRNGTSTSLVIHSTILTKIIKEWCGKLAHNKKIPSWCLCANDDFIRGLLDGYISGDGTINKRDIYICTSSVSKELIVGISELLNRFGIISKISQNTVTSNNLGTENIRPTNTLTIRNTNLCKFVNEITLTLTEKQDILEQCLEKNWRHEYGRDDIIPGNTFGIFKNKEISREKLRDMIGKPYYKNCQDIIKNIVESDVYFDPIVKIEEVEPSNPNNLPVAKVYDLTVADTRNFTTYGGLCLRDTFHATGSGSAALGGVARINELLSVTKKMKIPQMVIYLDDRYKNDKDMANKISSYIKYTTINDLVIKTDFYYDPKPNASGSFMERDNTSNPFFVDNSRRLQMSGIENLPWLLRITLNKEDMIQKDLTLLDVKARFVVYWNSRFGDTKKLKHKEKEIIPKIQQCGILSNHDNDDQAIIHIRFDIDNVTMSTLMELENIIINTFKLKGIEGITDIGEIKKEREILYGDNGEVIKSDQYIIITNGINIKNIRYINGVDLSKTMTNNVVETYMSFGIEAARAVILNEIYKVFHERGNDVNFHHLALLVDMMTNTGALTAINRHGINKLATDPLARASFEKTIDQLLAAAVFGEKDYMRSVSSRIMAGRVINGGTGLCDILLDHKKLENSEYIEKRDDVVKTFNELTMASIMDDIISKEEHHIFIPTF